MSETQASISKWADETFGHQDALWRTGIRANEEMAELLRALSVRKPHNEIAEEIADTVIVLMLLIENLGRDLQTEIDRKMAINRARNWVLDGTGHGYHKTAEAAGSESVPNPNEGER